MWESFSRVFEYVMILAVLAGLWWWQRRSRRRAEDRRRDREDEP